MALRQILEYPNPLLKKRAAPVATIGGEVATLIEDLAETMYAAPGVGLAATQVGVGQRVIVLDLHGEDEAPGKRLLKLINPEIAEREGEVVWEEGCLSVPGLTAPVKRARRVLVRAWTPEEREVEVEAEELLAVALQHEIDHLDGRPSLDRLPRRKPDPYRARPPKPAPRAPQRRRPGRPPCPRSRPRRGRRLRAEPAARRPRPAAPRLHPRPRLAPAAPPRRGADRLVNPRGRYRHRRHHHGDERGDGRGRH